MELDRRKLSGSLNYLSSLERMALSGQGCAKCWVTGGYLIAVAFAVQRLWINWGHHFWEAKVPWPPWAQVCVRGAFIKQQPGLCKGKNNQTKWQAPVPLQFILDSLPLKGMGRSQTIAWNWGKKLWKDWWESGLLWAPTSSAQFPGTLCWWQEWRRGPGWKSSVSPALCL